MNAMIKSRLEAIGNNKAMWDKRIEIENEIYIYVSARNEFRKEVSQPSGTVAALIGCMVLGKFVKCC